MDNYAALLGRMKVSATSPDQSVTGRLTAADGLRVELDPDRLAGHDDASLATLVSTTLTTTLTAGTRATTVAQDRSGVEHDPTALNRTELGKRRLRFEAAAERIGGEAHSADGTVAVELTGRTRARVRIRPRTVHNVPHVELTASINEALRAAREQQAKAVFAAYCEVFPLTRDILKERPHG